MINVKKPFWVRAGKRCTKSRTGHFQLYAIILFILAFLSEHFDYFFQVIFHATPFLVAVCVEDKQSYTDYVEQKDERTQNSTQLRNRVVTSQKI
jgi:hypothetical protein